ncbi:hypothetical protein K461DRAFT_294274 [Myriangium duriaei CBS 260.36]|uniref:Sulfate transporter CysZ n=1 Tax=Myriangium duriaei CBS 260.36 TaxID=1168546 RepID=A0A9P4MGX0_9PEZI|nr:hypothetical protein K461DRAFT_294274 [Myriangium duriaei CBS 260.36]
MPLRDLISRNFTLSWTYPLQGIAHFARNRSLWPLLKARLIPLAVLSLCTTLLLFLLTYLPQVAFLAVFHRAGSAWLNGTFLVLSEANLIVVIFFEAFLVDKTQVDIVDAVLIQRGHRALVERTRPVDVDEPDCVKCLGPRDKGAEYAPFSLRQIVEFVLLLPLNLVPYVGVPLFLLGTGYRAGPLQQWRYYKLKGFDKKQRKAYIKEKSHKWQMMWFGSVALLLQLIPVASLIFLLTTAVGTALWAADLEEAAARTRGRTSAVDGEPDGQPPPFADEA